jgi:hypothetical protein
MAMQTPSIDPDILDLLDFIGDRPEDVVLRYLLAQRLAEADHIYEARFVRQDYDMIRRGRQPRAHILLGPEPRQSRLRISGQTRPRLAGGQLL